MSLNICCYARLCIAPFVYLLDLIWQGPNFVWHVDGYEKLSPYGFSITGCIDGLVMNINIERVFNESDKYMYLQRLHTCTSSCIYVVWSIDMFVISECRYSRKLIWMEVEPTNHHPTICLKHFLNAVAYKAGNSLAVIYICSVFTCCLYIHTCRCAYNPKSRSWDRECVDDLSSNGNKITTY